MENGTFGSHERLRHPISFASNGGQECIDSLGQVTSRGVDFDIKTCLKAEMTPCTKIPYWDQWEGWSDCNSDLKKIRTRQCQNGNDLADCLGLGLGQEEDTCPEIPLSSLVHTGWTTWEMWTNCPVTCGNAPRFRRRSCSQLQMTKEKDACIPGIIERQESPCEMVLCPGENVK